MTEMSEPILEGSERNLQGSKVGASNVAAGRGSDCCENEALMAAVVERGNMQRAYQRVVRNKGSAGVDGMTIDELKPFLKTQWKIIKEELLEDRYKPQSVLRAEIPKPDGGVRKLGIPIVVDRLIGQAIHQVMEPIFDKGFSESSDGWRG